jgi:hypothetical protein
LIVFDVSLDARASVDHRDEMPSWSTFESAAPELAAEVRRRLDAHTHKTLATLRRDGAPRISGTESQIIEGELWIGSMPDALKAHDLQRDPRFALHSGSDDPPNWDGDAKLAGVAEEQHDPELVERINRIGGAPEGPSHLFRLDVHEVSTVGTNDTGDGIVVRVWTADGGLREIRRH